LQFTCSGKSFINNRNKVGPKTVPCGAPESTGNFEDVIPFKVAQEAKWHF